MKAKHELTFAAKRRAEQLGISMLMQNSILSSDMMRGDVVEFETPTGPERFVVFSRRFRFAADGTVSLWIELDHPVR